MTTSHRSLVLIGAAAGLVLAGLTSIRGSAAPSPGKPSDAATAAGPAQAPLAAGLTAEQIQDDYLTQARLRFGKAPAISHEGSVTTTQDAAGGVDGVKDGKWGFHTNLNDQPAWWQVDLGKSQALDRVLVYNRCDLAGRTTKMELLLSDDGKTFRQAYQHDGKPFYGFTDSKPLAIPLGGAQARFVRLQIPPRIYFHLDEVEIYGRADPAKNIALHQPADQSSVSQWSANHSLIGVAGVSPASAAAVAPAEYPVAEAVDRGLKLAADLRRAGASVDAAQRELEEISAAAKSLTSDGGPAAKEMYLRVCMAARKLALSNPLLDFDSILFAKRAPGTYSHMSDQYYSWWSRAGGGIFVLEGFKTDSPRVRCLTEKLQPGSFLAPDLSFDGRKVLFAYSRFSAERNGMRNKLDKDAQAEDSFFHIFEMNVDGTAVRQITHGRYDDMFARYLPDGQMLFLSTRRGTFLQCGQASAQATTQATLSDSFVRCGGSSYRPVALYTLHTMDSSGGNMKAISAFESFEWEPSVAADGRILYARWDYVDRFNGPYMKLWSTNPDGTGVQIVYGNYTKSPNSVFEARSIPGSTKLLCTASAHHSITAGSLILLDPTLGILDGPEPITRLTPEVCFPETEGWPTSYYNSPYPLSETHYLCAWGNQPLVHEGKTNPTSALGIYLYDAFGNLTPLYRDADISSMHPLPIRPRTAPPVLPSSVDWAGPQEGRFLLQNVYAGLDGAADGMIRRLRLVAMPVKTQPDINKPNIGVTGEDPGKCVLGTVPVEKDGSAYFRVPSGVAVFFQALDAQGRAVQTMRSLTYVQPGVTASCIGCHEGRNLSPAVADKPLAAMRGPSKITPDIDGTWPLRFDTLVQGALDTHCVSCHAPEKSAAKFDLTAAKSYENLMNFGKPSLRDNIKGSHMGGRSIALEGPSYTSAVLKVFAEGPPTSPVLKVPTEEKPRCAGKLDADTFRRLATWMDTYGQRAGSFCPEQEDQLRQFRQQIANLLEQ